MPELPVGTVTFLFTDIEGSTGLLKRLGQRYGAVLEGHARILREAAASHGGREIDNQGDSFFFVFPRANDALAAAVVAQRALAVQEWPDGAEVQVRMGLHTGEPSVGGERYVGLGVHRAARIGAAGHGGQVLLSNATRELVEEELDAVVVHELGLYRLKDIDRPERLFQLEIAGLKSDFPPLKAEKVKPTRRFTRRPMFIGAIAGVIAAAVAIPVFAFGSGGGSPTYSSLDADSVGAISGGRIVGSVQLGAAPSAITSGAGSLWVVTANKDAVSRISPASREIEQTISVGSGPTGVAYGGASSGSRTALPARSLRSTRRQMAARLWPRSPSGMGRVQSPTASARCGSRTRLTGRWSGSTRSPGRPVPQSPWPLVPTRSLPAAVPSGWRARRRGSCRGSTPSPGPSPSRSTWVRIPLRLPSATGRCGSRTMRTAP